MLNDVRHAIRFLLSNKLFTALALTTLALGIGANSAMFAVINAVLVRSLPYGDPDRLVLVEERILKISRDPMMVPVPDVLDFQRNSTTFDGVAAFIGKPVDLTLAGEPERLQALRITPNLFQLLGVAPVLGRSFTPDEDRPGATVAIVSYRLWQQYFGGDSHVIGRQIELDRQRTTVVGVMPQDFEFPLPGLPYGGARDLWIPTGFTAKELATHDNFNVGLIARLKPGVSHQQAEADVQRIARAIYDKLPSQVRAGFELDAQAWPITERVVHGSRQLLLLLMGIVAFVLLIACVNLSNLLLGRIAGRQRELAVRTSMGATRARLFRQLLTESLVLSTVGGTLGLFAAMWLVKLLTHMLPASVPRVATIDIDWHVVLFCAAVSICAGALFGTLPAALACRGDMNLQLKEAGRGAVDRSGGNRIRGFLVLGQVALALVLMLCAGLLVRSFLALRAVDPGFDAEHILLGRIALPPTAYTSSSSVREFYKRLLEALGRLPGTIATGAATSPLLNLAGQHLFVLKDPAVRPSLCSHAEIVSSYFTAAGIALHRGRLFDSRDRVGSQPVIIINETFAKRYFPGQDAVGQQVKLGSQRSPDPWYTIIGVVADVKNNGLSNDVMPQTYSAYSQLDDAAVTSHGRSLIFVVRAKAGSDRLLSSTRQAIAHLDPQLPITDLESGRALIDTSLAPINFRTELVGAFAGLALLLAALGIYGVISYAVSLRTPEIGLRIALGASRLEVFRLIIRQGMSFVLAGIFIGLGAAIVLTRLFTGFLYGVKATDPLTFTVVPLLFMLVALAAHVAPVRRAMHVDPGTALRHE